MTICQSCGKFLPDVMLPGYPGYPHQCGYYRVGEGHVITYDPRPIKVCEHCYCKKGKLGHSKCCNCGNEQLDANVKGMS